MTKAYRTRNIKTSVLLLGFIVLASCVDTDTESSTPQSTNSSPVAISQTISLDEDASQSITLSATDNESDTLSYSITSQPSNGTLTGNAPNVTYTPNANYSGADSFSFKANDGTVDSQAVTISLTVTAVNDAPIAITQALSLDEDTTQSIALSATDADGDNLSYSITIQPSNGTLTGTAPNLIYTPNANYNGVDSFSFKANDGTVDSQVVIISLTVTAVNDVPTASAQSIDLQKNESKAIILSATDGDGENINYTVVSQPSFGALSGTPPNITYTPNTDYTGADSFTFKAGDGIAFSSTVTISLTVNVKPLANAQSITFDEDVVQNITLTGSDPDDKSLTYIVATQPSNGVLSGSGETITYTPNTDYNGLDSFSFKTNNGTGDSDLATISLTINAVADIVVSHASVVEGDSGNVSLTFSVTLKDFESNASVDYATVNNTAVNGVTGVDDDYVAKMDTLNFTSGFLSQNIIIEVIGDNSEEYDETFNLVLSNFVNAQANNLKATGLIKGDDFVEKQNDTGITNAGDATSTGGANHASGDCTTSTTMGEQDCHQGRDTDLDNSDGWAGFSLTKLDATGKELADQSVSNHACVRDNVTGLYWEVKATSGIRSNLNTYKWGGLTALGRDHANKEGTYNDDWNELVNYANDTNNANKTAEGLCGFNDWRVPSLGELTSIVVINDYQPDTNYFPNTNVGAWSASPRAAASAWHTWSEGSNGYQTHDGARTALVGVSLVRGRK